MNNGILTAGYLPALSPFGLLGSPKPIRMPDDRWHPEANSWLSRVIANGGSVDFNTMSAVDEFCRSIDTFGLRDLLLRVNLFCGNNLPSCLVPLYRGYGPNETQQGNATDTNNNFVSADYSNATGLTGGSQASGKWINISISPNTIGMGACHAGVYANQGGLDLPSGAIQRLFGSNTSIGSMISIADTYTSATYNIATTNNTGAPVVGAGRGFMIGTRNSLYEVSAYRNGCKIGQAYSQYTSVLSNSTAILIFNWNNPTSPTANRYYSGSIRAYTFGKPMTDGQINLYYKAMQAFQSRLGRAV